jgi:hypothetical protein
VVKVKIVVARASLALSLLLTSFAPWDGAKAQTLAPEIIAKIHQTTFEVVAAKPVDEPLVYEKPLPLELLPFQERNDKYYSIGTAFSIGHNRYVTAGIARRGRPCLRHR